ncbi:MAG TPA: HD domain-containing protein [Syntrophobacteraceae bacterium]|nr:HD domain-containing protein [Syntrophobacteraceae bacterium]
MSRGIFRLKYKVALLVLSVSLACAGTIGLFSFLTAKHHVSEMMDLEYMGSVNRVKQLIRDYLEHAGHEVRFLLHLSPVQGIIRARSNNGFDPVESLSLKQWKRQLENIFEQDAHVDGRYMQISLLDASGVELVRVERNGAGVRTVPEGELQDTSAEPFFSRAMKLERDGIYTSPFHLHRERGRVVMPPIPVIQFASPVFDREGNRCAVLLICFSAKDILNVKHMFGKKMDSGNIFISDQAGFYLYNSRYPSREWGGAQNLGSGANLAQDYTDEPASRILSGDEGVAFFDGRELFYSTLRISGELSLTIGLDAPREMVEAPLRQFRIFLVFVIAGILAMTWAFSAYFVRPILASIHALTAATARIALGDLQTEVTVSSNDEIRDLTEGFSSMLEALRKKTGRLTGLYELGVRKEKSAREVADRMVSFIASTTGSGMAFVERANGNGREVVSCFKDGRIVRAGKFPLEGAACEEILREGKAFCCDQAQARFPLDAFLKEQHVNGYAAVPVVSGNGKPIGTVAAARRRAVVPAGEDIELLHTLSRLIALEWEQEAHISEIKEASLDTIHRLARAAEYRDKDTGAHLQRMSRYAAAIARRMGMDERMVESILYAAPMHDVGKIGVPDRILLKPGKLDAEEWEIMKQHTLLGELILEGSQNHYIKLAKIIAATHHERWDGTGYPMGLKGEEIPLIGRITAVADVFDALTSRRPYKEPFPLENAFAIIKEGKGSHFDPKVVEAFFAVREEVLTIRTAYRDEDENRQSTVISDKQGVIYKQGLPITSFLISAH